VRFSVLPSEGISLRNMNQGSFLSPDGRRIVFNGTGAGISQLWVRELDSLEARPLPGTEDAFLPFWSPDSHSIGFFSNNAVKLVDASGGRVRTLCAVLGLGTGGTWSRDGFIIFSSTNSSGLFSVPAIGGSPVKILDSSSSSYRLPFLLPDGRRFLFTMFPSNEARLGSVDSTNTTKVVDTESQVVFVQPGYLLFVRQGVLVAQPFDPHSGTLSGEFHPLVENMEVYPSGYAPFSASANGSLAYRVGSSSETTQLTWVDRGGKALGTVSQPGRYRNPLLSPDQSRIAIEVAGESGRNRDIWQIELARGASSRLTFDPRNDIYPVWSPEGSRIAFGSDRENGMFSVYQRPSNGSAAEELLFKSTSENAAPYSWSPDGQILVTRYINNGSYNTGLLALAGDRKLRPFQSVTFTQVASQVSPGGQWIAYQSNESGRYEVWVETFPTPGGKWQVSKDGGTFPKWRGDGKEIFYYAVDGQLMAAPIENDNVFRAGPAVPLFKAEILNGPVSSIGFRAQYDVTRDGQRFLLNVPVEDSRSSPINVVLNWAAGLATH
jgi:Tol biopolymer transport system component